KRTRRSSATGAGVRHSRVPAFAFSSYLPYGLGRCASAPIVHHFGLHPRVDSMVLCTKRRRIMLHARIATALAIVCPAGTALWAQQDKSKQEDPPKHMEGVVKIADSKDPRVQFVTISVKEQVPTAQEDIFREVDKDYRFRVNDETKILGIDGKPDRRG